MSYVSISSARFRSMLANRNRTVADASAELRTHVDLEDLVRRDLDVPFEDILLLAKYFKRPWSYLLLDDPEEMPSLGQDHRTFGNRRVPVSPELWVELEAVSNLLDDAIDLFPGDRYTIPPGVEGERPDAVRLAASIRTFLGVTEDDQLAAKDGFASLRSWVSAVHEKGVYVLQRKLPDESVRALSVTRGDHAVIVVDTSDPAYARVFSLLHEYTHIVTRTAGVCDFDDHATGERYCNAVAATVLLPESLLRRVLVDVRFSGGEEEDDETLIRLSKRLRVSQAALLIRLRDRGTLKQDLYDRLESRRSQRRSGRGGKSTYYAPAINRVGRKFARNVVGAWGSGELDRQEASTLLGIGEHTAERFRRELLRGEVGK